MSHLSIDRLAAIADETPLPDEATHLAGCWDCRAEVHAYRRLARLSALAPVPDEPLTAWSKLAPQLKAAGLIGGTSGGSGAGGAAGAGEPTADVLPFSVRRSTIGLWATRLAAGIALVAGGAAVGRVTAPEGELPIIEPNDIAAATSGSFQTPEQALAALNTAQSQYQSAAAYLAGSDTESRFVGMNQDNYRARLAALDEIAATTRAALYRSPQDPMLNQYYLTTLGAREATLREIGAAMPDTRRLERY
jgi:hypothetical protein